MFIDHVKIKVKSGDGGRGCVSFRREKFIPLGGPDGGDGGNGGAVIFTASKNIMTLMDFHYNALFKAGNGRHGQGNKKTGACGEHCYITVPAGTQIKEERGSLIADLTEDSQNVVVAKGGLGGRGNVRFTSSTNRAPRKCEPGKPGEELTLYLELKLIADFALVGYPNAGKSTLISVLSDATPKIASYPFTTLIPNLGVLNLDDIYQVVLADVPGLIDGAHEGVGLGFDFLRHIERCKGLIYVCDMSEQDPLKNFRAILKEIRLYNKDIAMKPNIVVANKMDLPGTDKIFSEFKKKMDRDDIFAISAKEKLGLERLIEAIREITKTVIP